MRESKLFNEIRAEAYAEGASEALVVIVQHIFRGVVTPDITTILSQQRSLFVIREWSDAAIIAPTYDAFLARIHDDLRRGVA